MGTVRAWTLVCMGATTGTGTGTGTGISPPSDGLEGWQMCVTWWAPELVVTGPSDPHGEQQHTQSQLG